MVYCLQNGFLISHKMMAVTNLVKIEIKLAKYPRSLSDENPLFDQNNK